MDNSLLFSLIGFLLASYSIIANDAIQTLGTFIGSNKKRAWYILWLYTASILSIVLIYGWLTNSGDVSYGRLDRFEVPNSFQFVYIIPPLVVLILTRFGIPVSTTFIVLTVFSPAALNLMLTKSIFGYLLAFVVSFLIYRFVAGKFEKRCCTTKEKIKSYWYVLQWASTGFLWSQWLIQDLANIFIYMPTRSLSELQLTLSLITLVIMLGIIFYLRGGAIQHVVTSKTNTSDIRVATIIDFTYALILLFFKEYSNIPMSTTWVFIGLLAGREFAISFHCKHLKRKDIAKVIAKDIGKVTIGLAISVAIALAIPKLLSFS